MPTRSIDDPRNANAEEIVASVAQDVSGDSALGGLVEWIMDRVRDSRETRNSNHRPRWDQHERVYRGKWAKEDATREGERSRLISPALTQAIDSTAAHIEDAIFSRDQWFELIDDYADANPMDIEASRLLLNEDFDAAGVPDALAAIVLNGCLYGTGIGKIGIERKEYDDIVQDPDTGEFVSERKVRAVVTLEAVAPWEFVIDENARTCDAALFCAHEMNVPINRVWSKMQAGTYRKLDIGTFFTQESSPVAPGGEPLYDPEAQDRDGAAGGAWITEYHGKVPASLLPDLPDDARVDAGGLVESIITIANEQHVLRAIANPFLGQERMFVAYQHFRVPGRFWGESVADKGWNSQKALDSELRARMDALGLITSPMLGADITKLPRMPDMKVRPGKIWPTRGRPSEILEPIIMGQIQPTTFSQSGELERMVSVGTGSIDSNAPLDNNRRNETASGMSMMQSSALKRMRRAMWNMERQLLNPFIRKATRLYMQFEPTRYPVDLKFGVKGTMGIVAREYEQSNLTALLSVIPPDHPSYGTILQGVIELSGTPHRDDLLKAIRAAAEPSPEEQQMEQMQQQAAMRMMQLEVAQAEAELVKTQAEAQKAQAEAMLKLVQAELEDDKVEIQATNAATGMAKAAQAVDQNRVAREKIRVDMAKVRKDVQKTTSDD